MRVAIVTESFLPHHNGVTNSVLRVLEELRSCGHEAIVIAPGYEAPPQWHGVPVLQVPSLPFPGYGQVRISVTTQRRIAAMLNAFAPDVVHLASPFLLGAIAVKSATTLGIPTVAVYQTDVAAFAGRYGVPWTEDLVWNRIQQIHASADRTLAPSSHAAEALRRHGVPRVHRWGRGVNAVLFDPSRRDETLRASWGVGPDDVVVGTLGRLAPEKQHEDLVRLRGLDRIKQVVIGDGPRRAPLEALLSEAHFTGHLSGELLAAAVASVDVLVQPSDSETFSQSVQEGLASGVPVVAPALGGPLDLVDHSRTGWLYPAGDLDSMADHVRDLAGDDAKRRSFSQAARASVAPRTWASVVQQLVEHYQAASLVRHLR